jgi:hypothetical protein
MCTCKPKLKWLNKKTCLNIQTLESNSNQDYLDQSESDSDKVSANPDLGTEQYQQQEKNSPTSNDDSSNGKYRSLWLHDFSLLTMMQLLI